MRKNKKKVIYKEDDGRTLYDMSGVSRDNFMGSNQNTNSKNQSSVYLTKKERRAVIIAGLKHYLPILFMVISCFAVAIILVYLWLS